VWDSSLILSQKYLVDAHRNILHGLGREYVEYVAANNDARYFPHMGRYPDRNRSYTAMGLRVVTTARVLAVMTTPGSSVTLERFQLLVAVSSPKEIPLPGEIEVNPCIPTGYLRELDDICKEATHKLLQDMSLKNPQATMKTTVFQDMTQTLERQPHLTMDWMVSEDPLENLVAKTILEKGQHGN
jgi:hypothetical protein